MFSEIAVVEISLFILGAVGTVFWYLLRQKDARQQKDMDEMKATHAKDMDTLRSGFQNDVETLWDEHNKDAERLRSLELLVASKHYEKSEIDTKLDRLNDTMRDGFRGVNELLGKLIPKQ